MKDLASTVRRPGSSSKGNLLISWVLVTSYMAIIFFLSTLPNPTMSHRIAGGGFFLHLIEYGVLGLLLSLAFVNSGVEKRLMLYVFLAGLLYGATDEIHQSLVPQRTSSLLDLTADGLGSLLGAFSFRRIS